MAILSAKLILVASGALSYVLVQHTPESLPPPLRTSYIGVFASLCLVQFVALFTYAMFLKPFWLSPLTKLPQPKVRTESSLGRVFSVLTCSRGEGF